MTVHIWWALLAVVATANLVIWGFAAARVRRTGIGGVQLLLSGFYVFGCAFRSFLPVYDIPRMCLVDFGASSVLVGRTVATLAETAFAAQWAVFLHAAARAAGSEAVRRTALALVPLIVIAEICSWYAVLTTVNLGHVFENSLWGMSAALIVACLFALSPQWPAGRRAVLHLWLSFGVLYVAYMFMADVPMYWSRWVASEAEGGGYLSLAQGVIDASQCRQQSFRWEDWRSEVTWMTLYFSVGVWVSLSLVFMADTRGIRSRGGS